MTQQHIIFVPGKNPKPAAEQHRNILWRILLEGVKRAAPDLANDLKDTNVILNLVHGITSFITE